MTKLVEWLAAQEREARDKAANYGPDDGNKTWYAAQAAAYEAAHAYAIVRPDRAALSAQSTGSAGVAAEPVAGRTLRQQAQRMIEAAGWKPGDQMHGMALIELMVKFGQQVRDQAAEEQCNYPDCGCDHDAVCETGVRLLAAAPPPPAGGGETKIIASDGDEIDAGYIGGAAMQVIGTIAEAAGFWGRPEIEAALKYFGGEGWTKGQEILPFVMAERAEPSAASPAAVTNEDIEWLAREAIRTGDRTLARIAAALKVGQA